MAIRGEMGGVLLNSKIAIYINTWRRIISSESYLITTTVVGACFIDPRKYAGGPVTETAKMRFCLIDNREKTIQKSADRWLTKTGTHTKDAALCRRLTLTLAMPPGRHRRDLLRPGSGIKRVTFLCL